MGVEFKDEYIFKEGEVGRTIYFISAGIVDVESKHIRGKLKTVGTGCYFGDVAVFGEENAKRTASMKVQVNAMLYVIDGSHLVEILKDHPHVEQYMRYIARKRHKRLALLDPKANIPKRVKEKDVLDREDSTTKYFQKIPGLAESELVRFQEAINESHDVSNLPAAPPSLTAGMSSTTMAEVGGPISPDTAGSSRVKITQKAGRKIHPQGSPMPAEESKAGVDAGAAPGTGTVAWDSVDP